MALGPNETITGAKAVRDRHSSTRYISEYIPSGINAATTDCYQWIQQAVNDAGIAGTIVFPAGKVKCNTEIQLLNYQKIVGHTQWYGSGGPTAGATSYIDFSGLVPNTAQGNTRVGFRVAVTNTFEDLMLNGPGLGVTGSYGVSAFELAPQFNRCSFYNWEHGIHLVSAWFTEIRHCGFYFNKDAIYADSCYNLSVHKPIARCSAIDRSVHGTFVRIVNYARGLKMYDGTVEDYSTAIVGASDSDIGIWGVYFESPIYTGATTIDLAGASGTALLVQGCTVYLTRHTAFLNAPAGCVKLSIRSNGNRFIYPNMSLTPAPTVPIAYNMGTSIGEVDLGEDNWSGVFFHAVNQASGYTNNMWTAGKGLTDFNVRFPFGDQSGRNAHFYVGRNLVLPAASHVKAESFRAYEGTNARQGVATLVGGTVTVPNTSITANSRIQLTVNTPGGTVGSPYVSARIAGTSFTISSTAGAADTSTVAYQIFEPA